MMQHHQHHDPYVNQINTENVFRDKDLDVGFILRASTEVAGILHAAIKDKSPDQAANAKLMDLALSLLDPKKRTYG